MKVVILCGGKGTRLREETEFKPKPLVEIGGMPILWHIMKIYSHYGFKDFILCLGYKGNMIKDYFLNLDKFANDFTLQLGKGNIITHSPMLENWNITFADTGENTDTGGRIKKVEKYLDDTFFLTYGDGVANINLNTLLKYHEIHKPYVTVTGVRPKLKFGILQTNEQGWATSFSEKPETDGLINGGFYVCNMGIFNYLDDDCNLEHDTLPKLVKDKNLYVYEHKGYWQCMDTYKEAEELNMQWKLNKRPWVIWQ